MAHYYRLGTESSVQFDAVPLANRLGANDLAARLQDGNVSEYDVELAWAIMRGYATARNPYSVVRPSAVAAAEDLLALVEARYYEQNRVGAVTAQETQKEEDNAYSNGVRGWYANFPKLSEEAVRGRRDRTSHLEADLPRHSRNRRHLPVQPSSSTSTSTQRLGAAAANGAIEAMADQVRIEFESELKRQAARLIFRK